MNANIICFEWLLDLYLYLETSKQVLRGNQKAAMDNEVIKYMSIGHVLYYFVVLK